MQYSATTITLKFIERLFVDKTKNFQKKDFLYTLMPINGILCTRRAYAPLYL